MCSVWMKKMCVNVQVNVTYFSTAESPKHRLPRHISRSFSLTHKDERGAGLNKIEYNTIYKG